MTRLPRSRLSTRNEMNKNRYKHFSHAVKMKIMRMRMYKFKFRKCSTYCYHVVMSMSSLAKWNGLHLNTKIYYSAY